MGTGKVYRCKDCGHEWSQLRGVGFSGVKAEKPKRNKSGRMVCPECSSVNIEPTDIEFLWD
jgi:rubredoxin